MAFYSCRLRQLFDIYEVDLCEVDCIMYNTGLRHASSHHRRSKVTIGCCSPTVDVNHPVYFTYTGSMQATSHHLGIEAGQVWRLRSLQDQLVTCLIRPRLC